MRRVALGAGGQLTPEEAGFYPVENRQEGLGEGRRCRLVFTRKSPTGLNEDTAQIDFEFVNYTGGLPDDSWTDADFLVVENALTTWWAAIDQRISDSHVLDQLRWYAFGPSLPKPAGLGEQPGPARRIVDRNNVGFVVGGESMYQLAVSCTLRTGVRRRWGRFYLPGLVVTNLTDLGRLEGGITGELANATDAFFTTCLNSDIVPVVYSPTVRRAYGIEAISVDDIPDVIRSRRPKQVQTRVVINS
jgi:hypothetical protein